MSEQKESKPVRGPIVEDESCVGGVDAASGAAVIRPKNPDGGADESTTATDPNERQKPRQAH